MSAVVKNKPRQYFKQKDNWNLNVLVCLYRSVNLWKSVEITILLNRTTNRIMPKTTIRAD